MSEPASLYARLTLDPACRAAFLASRPTPPAGYDDWAAWLERQQIHGGVPDAGTLQSPSVAASSVDELLQGWQRDPWFGMPPITTDAQGRIVVVMLQATGNFLELLHLLAPLRAAAAWTQPDADDFVLVTDFLFDPGQPAMACLALSDGGSRFVDDVPDAWRGEAVAAFETALQRMQELHAD